ncbi:MAG: ATP-binding protein [Alphaproteobacteria bacterium]|nr:ATP-binding protein [Alphaproteobacteria bacterium]
MTLNKLSKLKGFYKLSALTLYMHVLCAALMLMFCFVGGSVKSFAASNNTLGVIALNSEMSSIDLKGKVFVFEDKFKKYNLSSAWKEINAKPSSFLSDSRVLRLTSQSSSYWMMLRINNQSETDNWILDFGDTFNGRSGFVKKIMAYDVTERELILKIFGNENQELEKSDNLIESALLLDLPRGKTSHLVLYVEPAAKKPFIIAPRLYKKTQYFGRGINLLDRHNMTIYVYIALLFMMVTFTLMYRKPHQLFGTLFLFFGLVHYLVENTVLYAGVPLYEQTLFFSFILTQICLFYVFYNYFYDKVISSNFMQQMALGMPALALVLTGFSVLAVPDDYAYLVFLAAIFVVILANFILFAANIKSKVLVKYLTMLAGLLYSGAIFAGSISIEFSLGDKSYLFGYAYVYAQLAISLLLILSMPIRRPTDKKAAAPLSGIGKNVFPSGANYRNSKDTADRERLLRVLDRERELLDEARSREAEKTEEMRLAKDLADEANKAKSAFLAVISHEIRTPITGVLGMVKLLMGTSLSDTQKDYAQTIQDSGDAMLALLNDILDYEKIESGKLELEFISFDVRRLMQGIERLMSGHAEAKKIGLGLSIESDVPEFIVGDPTRLRQVVLNLLSNAIKFTDYGDVKIIVKRIDMGTSDEKKMVPGATGLSGNRPIHSVYFGVQDSGIGLSNDAQKNLFTPFTQAKAETTRKYGGTGLGLSICQKLINAMGGEISVNSKEGEGSTFFFTLDMQEGDAAEALSEDGTSKNVNVSGKSYRMLAVDDNSINLKVLNGFLDKLGHVCIKVESGEEALERLMSERFDMVFMDVNMRGMSGLETTRKIREMQHVEKSAIPIVALTGNSGMDAVHECYEAGMDDFILKPVNPNALSTMVNKYETNEFSNEITTKKYKEIRQTLLSGGSMNAEDTPIVSIGDKDAAPQGIVNDAMVEASVETIVASTVDVDDDELPVLPAQMETNVYTDTSDVANAEGAVAIDGGVSPLQQFIHDESEEDVDQLVADTSNADKDEPISDAFRADIEARGEVFEASLLEALKLSMDHGELVALVDGFDEKGQEILSGLSVAHQSKDWTTLGQRAHEMKGMAGNFGLRALSEMMKELENLIKNKKFNEIEYFMVRTPIAYSLGIKAIKNWISN